MEKPSDNERDALRQYMAEMEIPTRNLHEGVRRSIRALKSKPPNRFTAAERITLATDLRKLERLPGTLPQGVPDLARAGHVRWLHWARTAFQAGRALARGIEYRDQRSIDMGLELLNSLPELKNEIISPEMVMWCRPDDVLEVPITDDEYAEMLRVRKSNSYPNRPSTDWDRWSVLTSRYLYQFPSTAQHEMRHEAAHIVVGHRLGWRVERIARHPDGTPHAIIPPPCEPPELPILDYSTVSVAGFLAEDKAFGSAMPSTDHINAAHMFRDQEARQGRRATPESTLAHVLEAETRAQTIMDENWEVVGRIANLALQGLPVNRDALLGELLDVAQAQPPCGLGKQRPLRRARRHSLLTTRGVQEGIPGSKA